MTATSNTSKASHTGEVPSSATPQYASHLGEVAERSEARGVKT